MNGPSRHERRTQAAEVQQRLDDGRVDVFVHYTGIEGGGFRSPAEGDRVSYETAPGRRGERAQNVRKV